MLNRCSVRSALLALTFPLLARAQIDVAALQQRTTAAAGAVQQALASCKDALAAVRKAIGDPDNKVQGDCTDIENVLGGGTFDAGLGAVPIALEHLEYVAEDRRAATQQALVALRRELQAGSVALQRQEALQELAARMEQLAHLGADDDASASLADLAASAGKATRSAALPKADLALLQQQLAKRRLQNAERLGKELAALAKADLDHLQQEFADLRAAMDHQDAGERDRGFARFDEAARGIRTALARLPAAGRGAMAAVLDKLQATADELYRRHYAASTLTRVKESWTFTADQFDGWQDESAEITAAGHVNFEPPSVDVFCLPKTVALVGRANAWLAFAGQDPDCRRNRKHAGVAAFTQSILELRTRAHAKLLPLVKAVVDGMAGIEISEDRIRGRLQTLADWDLPMALQVHPEVSALRAKVHALLDAHDRKTLGDEQALATIRGQAMVAADALWPRFQSWLPVEGGFDPATAPLFVGRLMRLEGVWLRTDEFERGAHEMVFDLGGQVFAATMTKALAADVRTTRARLQLPGDLPSPGEAIELLAVVGDDVELRLLGPKGRDDALTVPATAVQVVGLRQGGWFAVAP